MSDLFVLPDGALPVVHDPEGRDAQFWQGTQNEEVWIQRCAQCRKFQWLPEWMCHHCHSFGIDFDQVSPNGRIYSWERVWHPSSAALADHCPYIVVVVELDDAPGIRLVGNLLGDGRQDVNIGSRVSGVFEHHTDYTLLQWRTQP